MEPTKPRRERVLVYGAPKSGKTRCWASLVDHGQRVWALDPDYRAVQSLEHVEDQSSLVCINVPNDWEELVEMTVSTLGDMEKDDWLVLDSITYAWQYVTSYYIEQVMGKKPADFFLEFRKGGGKGNPMAGAYGENWNVINSMYRDWIMKVIRCKGHVLACAQGRKMDGSEDSNIKKVFGAWGFRPEGQKDLGFQFDSIIMTGFGKGPKDFILNTVGDTNREGLVDVRHGDFAVDYLMKVGGWKL